MSKKGNTRFDGAKHFFFETLITFSKNNQRVGADVAKNNLNMYSAIENPLVSNEITLCKKSHT